MNNAVFGKMIENVRKRRDIRLITNEDRRKKLVSQPNYASCTPFSTELMAIEIKKTRIYMDKPTLVGQAILDKSKELMYNFFYDYMKPKFGSRAQLLYVDTDSFMLPIKTDNFFDDTKDDLKEWCDTSRYDKNMILPDVFKQNGSVNKKVIGQMKDEIGKGYMTEFVALSPKVYAYQQINISKNIFMYNI